MITSPAYSRAYLPSSFGSVEPFDSDAFFLPAGALSRRRSGLGPDLSVRGDLSLAAPDEPAGLLPVALCGDFPPPVLRFESVAFDGDPDGLRRSDDESLFA